MAVMFNVCLGVVIKVVRVVKVLRDLKDIKDIKVFKVIKVIKVIRERKEKKEKGAVSVPLRRSWNTLNVKLSCAHVCPALAEQDITRTGNHYTTLNILRRGFQVFSKV